MARALSFLGSRIGIVAVAVIFGYFVGHIAASSGGKAKALKDENASLRADLAIFEVAAKRAEAEAVSLRAIEVELSEKVEAYREELKTTNERSSCRLDGADIKRLRNIK